MRLPWRGGLATWLLVALNVGVFAWMTAVDNHFEYEIAPATLPSALPQESRSPAAWLPSITLDDRDIARLDTCPFVSCRRPWPRDLGTRFLLP